MLPQTHLRQKLTHPILIAHLDDVKGGTNEICLFSLTDVSLTIESNGAENCMEKLHLPPYMQQRFLVG